MISFFPDVIFNSCCLPPCSDCNISTDADGKSHYTFQAQVCWVRKAPEGSHWAELQVRVILMFFLCSSVSKAYQLKTKSLSPLICFHKATLRAAKRKCWPKKAAFTTAKRNCRIKKATCSEESMCAKSLYLKLINIRILTLCSKRFLCHRFHQDGFKLRGKNSFTYWRTHIVFG